MRASLLGLLCVFGVACASGTPDSGGDDGGSPYDAAPTADAGTPDASGAPFGDPCEEHIDCQSGLCYHPEETGPGYCTESCTDLCPDGYACKTVVISEGVEADLCVPATNTFCNSCETSDECGDTSDLCVDLSAGRYCSIDCTGDPSVCPVGFTCQTIAGEGDIIIGMQCKPTSGICCIDADGDIRGIGDGCYTTDCDDTNPDVYDDALEVCDGLDNDCVGGVDVDVVDCGSAECMLGSLGYYERAAEPCVAGDCEAQSAVLCDLYTCADGGEAGDTCATACDVEDDAKCIPPAHCDASVCYDDVVNGTACDENSDCQSNHCQNGFCCDSGDCCQMPEDCPSFGTFDPVCESPPTCQGSRGEAVCVGFICGTTGMTADDSACDGTVLANECGFYKDIYCTGAATQSAPVCPTSCSSHADCDANGFCNPASNTCVGDRDDGQTCGENVWCKSGHCQNGFCCASGDCCADEGDCPASYSSDPVCTTPSACQGERDVAQCLSSICSTSTGVDDDSACTPGTLASDCGPYVSIFCTGSATQPPPTCPTSCTSDIQCDASAYCNTGGACVPDEPNGDTCNDDAECISGHCQNGFCCASGDCCAADTDCGAYDIAPECDNTVTCQGTRTDGVCSGTFQCGATVVNDDSACTAAVESDSCGAYPSVYCNGAVTQTQPTCSSSCADDGDCDVSAHCDASVCEPDIGVGGFCDEPTDCTGGLSCVDNVCCTSSCTGTCRACDVPGSLGTCTLIPSGVDLDSECGGVSCAGYYNGWSGDTCYAKANATAATVSCDGGGACQDAADVCPSQPVGSAVTTCDDTCQNPNLSTCTGTTAPICTDVNPGSQTCGLGICQVTVPLCVGGSDNTCVPGTPVTESCNNIDDNCNGTIDDGAFSDPYEPNGTCSSYTTLATVGSNQTQMYSNMTIYGSGDNDYYRINANETDSSCSCCDLFCTDEDYQLWITLTVPSGAGSYMFCTGSACSSVNDNCVEVLAGSTQSWIWTLDGGCPGGDSYSRYVRIYGDNSPGFECLPYDFSYYFDPGCF